MFSHLFHSRLFLSALALSLIAVIGAYFGGKWYFGNFTESSDESVKAALDAKDSPNTPKVTGELAQPTDSQEQVENPNSIGEVSGMPENAGQDATTNTSDETPLMGPITVDELWKLSPEEQKIALEALADFYREQFGVDPPPRLDTNTSGIARASFIYIRFMNPLSKLAQGKDLLQPPNKPID